MQKRTILMLISSIVMLLLTTVTFVFAWFTIVEKTQKIIISSGNVKMEYSLVEIKENNEKASITGPITYTNLVPGDNFEYYLEIKNVGNLDALLSISFEFESLNGLIAEAFILSYYQNSNEQNEVIVDFTENRIVLNDYELNPDDDYIQKFFVHFDSNYEDFSVNSNYVKIKTIKITLAQKN